jgi:hypothetical protein
MSHQMNHIDGISTAAAQYQAYLERMRAAHVAEEDKRVKLRTKGKNLEEQLDTEEESPREENENASPGEGETEGQQAGSGDGFGSHYA